MPIRGCCISQRYNLDGANLVNSGDYDERTALHLACEEGHFKVVHYLVSQKDVQLQPRDRWRLTPLDYARKHRRDRIIGLLVAAIAARPSSDAVRGGGGGARPPAPQRMASREFY